MSRYILEFSEVDRSKIALVGGKGANIGELSSIEGIQVPPGFCISTKAYEAVVEKNVEFNLLLDDLTRLHANNIKGIGEIGERIRAVIGHIPVPGEIQEEVRTNLKTFDEGTSFAVRSSATAEDLPTASFAGQQDSYLNISGAAEIIKHISLCWASLFTERAIVYRIQNGFNHRDVRLAVIIQEMVFADVAGIMFTADPVNSNRKLLSVDGSFGLGEALVSGLVNADHYSVTKGEIVAKKISAKKIGIHPSLEGGTGQFEIAEEQQLLQALTDEQILMLELLGRKIEVHFGHPQDIEWCLKDGVFYIVQSRPITTLYPLPNVNDQENHVYVSVGHQQMMTDAMKPLGLSVWLLTAARHMYVAGGRLFVDVAAALAKSSGRKTLIETLGQSDPLMRDALTKIVESDFIKLIPGDETEASKVITTSGFRNKIENDPFIVTGLLERGKESLKALSQEIQKKSGIELFDFIKEDTRPEKRYDPQSMNVVLAAMDAAFWINEKMAEWLGERNVADIISQSVPNNVTSEMGLALLDISDMIRPYPQLIEFLQHVQQDEFLAELDKYSGGSELRKALNLFLEKYGMRCAGEIDITRPRWSEKPSTLIPLLLSNIKNLGPHASQHRFEQGLKQALDKEADLLTRLRQLPNGEEKAGETAQMISLIRNFSGYREYPKYGIVSRYFIYKQAFMKEARLLVNAGAIQETEDVYYLSFDEFREAVASQKVDEVLIRKRKEEFKVFEHLKPPRVMTSDGEVITGSYNRNSLPSGAIAGLAVSSGIIEGRARIILNIEDANLEEGDILVTPFTDPSWTPLFLSIKGLVTEVGGLMTHGAVIAREYGLPAVVGIENATSLIHDGQMIRVNGTDGYVEII